MLNCYEGDDIVKNGPIINGLTFKKLFSAIKQSNYTPYQVIQKFEYFRDGEGLELFSDMDEMLNPIGKLKTLMSVRVVRPGEGFGSPYSTRIDPEFNDGEAISTQAVVRNHHKMNDDDKLIEDLLINDYEINEMFEKLAFFVKDNINYEEIINTPANECKLDLSEKPYIAKIVVPLKRAGYLKAAHNVCKYFYYKYGTSYILLHCWFKIFACAGMFNEAIAFLNKSNSIFIDLGQFDYYRESVYGNHLDGLRGCINGNPESYEYLKSISGNPYYQLEFIQLD